jgi:aerobic-type carbon monoxide dehydrogenase small subunit (CoxS/CutS family)
VYACLTLAAACEGSSITTIEGLSQRGELHPVQQAFIAHDAVQCGFCTPGQVLAATALLSRNAHPSEEEIRAAMSGNLCRCGTYPNIVKAIQDVAG